MRSFAQLLLLLLSAGVVALHATESRTVSLSALLAPVMERAAKPVPETPAPQAETKPARPVYNEIKLADILSRIESQLAEDIDKSAKLSLTSRYNWSGVKVREDLQWDVRLTSPFLPSSSGRWYPSFELVVEGIAMTEYRIPIQVALFKKVWIVDQNVQKGATVTGAVTRAVIRDVYAERTAPISASESLEHFEATRNLTRGRVLSWEDLEERPQVRKNAIVTVEFNKGALAIRMQARAMDDGMLGELITVRNLTTSREFIALVRGENLVEIKL
jgi:flagella basal body P-ring formation protein FlgA